MISMRREIIPHPRSKFVLVQCQKCKHKQIAFNKPAIVVKCLKCGEVLIEPSGGKGRLRMGRILKVLL